ncbi:hypothetical protein HOB87_15405 [Candidatus Woesearchaeota archaeon]|nr:hypothetical protein [Candidatus Woesearchaeota archaeon]
MFTGATILSLESCANMEFTPVVLAKPCGISEIYCSNECIEGYINNFYNMGEEIYAYDDSSIGVGLSFRLRYREPEPSKSE